MSPVLDAFARRAHTGQLGTSMERGPLLPKIYPPATPRQIKDAEAELGFPLPALLRDLYLNVANGGFGPGYGLFSLAGGTLPPDEKREQTLVNTYTSFRYHSHRQQWDEKLLPICTWGCTYFSYIDCARPQAPVMGFDQNSHGQGPWGCAFSLHAKSFEEWMQRWLDGEDLWQSIGLCGEPKFGYKEDIEDRDPVRLTRIYKATPEAVFDAWLTPGVMRRWLFKGPGNEIARVDIDARAGGRHVILVQSDGKAIEYVGRYEVIERPRRLIFELEVSGLFGGVSRVSLDVAPTQGGSRLELMHTGVDARRILGPWNYMLDRLGRVLTENT